MLTGMAADICGICQRAFDSTSAEDHIRWLLEHNCFATDRVTPSKSRIVRTVLSKDRMLIVILSDGSREYIFEDGKMYEFRS